MGIGKDTSMAVGDVYAAALCEAAEQAGQLDEVYEQFTDLVGYFAHEPDVEAFLTALTVDDEVRRASLDRLFRGRMNDLLLNTLHVLNDRGRADILRPVYRCFQLRMERIRNQIEVEVYSAAPLPEDLRGELVRVLSERLGKEAILNLHVNESLLGGLIVQVGDRRLDMSLSHHLAALRRRLLERASQEIHSAKPYFSDSAA